LRRRPGQAFLASRGLRFARGFGKGVHRLVLLARGPHRLPARPTCLGSGTGADASADCKAPSVDEALVAGLHVEVSGVGRVNALERVLGNAPGVINVEEMHGPTQVCDAGNLLDPRADNSLQFRPATLGSPHEPMDMSRAVFGVF